MNEYLLERINTEFDEFISVYGNLPTIAYVEVLWIKTDEITDEIISLTRTKSTKRKGDVLCYCPNVCDIKELTYEDNGHDFVVTDFYKFE